MRFLVIEDNKADTELLTRYIQKSFPTATVDACGKFMHGLKCLMHEKYDGIFLDLNLPDNWGISTVKELKPYTKGAPIYVTTGIAHWVTVEEAKKAGAADVKEKRALSTETITDMVGGMALVG